MTAPAKRIDFGLILLIVGVCVIAALVAWSWSQGGIVWQLLSPDRSANEKLSEVKAFFLGFGLFAPIVYVAFVTVEVVVAPLPGVMLYAPGGIVFGGFLGGLLSLVGNVLGAGIACYAMRRLGGRFAKRIVDSRSLHSYSDQLSGHGVLVIAVLRVNPLTSSDLVSYAAGLTEIPIWKIMCGTMIGMAPLCWTQAYLADNLLDAFPTLIYPLVVACIVYIAVVLVVMRKIIQQAPDQ